jgi:hypothetical protein
MAMMALAWVLSSLLTAMFLLTMTTVDQCSVRDDGPQIHPDEPICLDLPSSFPILE